MKSKSMSVTCGIEENAWAFGPHVGWPIRRYPMAEDNIRGPQARQFTQRNGHARKVLHFDHAIGEFEFIFGRVEMFGGKFENFLAHNFRRFIDRIARNDRAAAGERPRAPIELIGVARDNIDLIDIHAELLCDDLRKTREVTLSLRAHTRHN